MSQNNNRSGVFEASAARITHYGEKICRLAFTLSGEGAKAFELASPGQFAQFQVEGLALPSELPEGLEDKAVRQPILRRPFSFLDVYRDGEDMIVEIMCDIIGTGTARLSALNTGDKVSILGPLGRGFEKPAEGRKVIGVAGGIGIPPVEHFLRQLCRDNPRQECFAFAGARCKADMPIASVQQGKDPAKEEYSFCRHFAAATDDGSFGKNGLVTEAFESWFADSGLAGEECEIAVCGPEPMLKAIAKTAHKLGIRTQVSLEKMMACGIGVCQSCVVPVKKGDGSEENKLCCKDGPVFDSREVFPE
ncbi:hypothetical protein [Sedimentisphaera salicampi]|uniref:Dihydroorotate oxidase B, electron transfer subunit n=1 Tax=Sedimentisphaera salicampi TaxID=1941349 RepID=A0A1W6LLI7_9BACT|nr:hypothetical protein [Sedimentisphaera salicampi]ARN56616.1 Dihydroorotate oxidase B, electron transfer subunit [Sedimentisphaera salicampi]OXU15503.1 Dihydroorotate oxidase B, electron transfer subunit [Sedimentisphaera salicampi]